MWLFLLSIRLPVRSLWYEVLYFVTTTVGTFYRVFIQPKRYSISLCKIFWSKWKYIVGERIAKMKRQCRTSALWLRYLLRGGKSIGIFEGIGVRRIRSKWFNRQTHGFLANCKCFQCRKEENSLSKLNIYKFLSPTRLTNLQENIKVSLIRTFLAILLCLLLSN